MDPRKQESLSQTINAATELATEVGNRKTGLRDKLKSRKLWVSFAGVLVGIGGMLGFNDNTVAIVAFVVLEIVSVLAYCIAEGMIDAKNAGALMNAMAQLLEMLDQRSNGEENPKEEGSGESETAEPPKD